MLAGTFLEICSCDSTNRLLLFTEKRIKITQGTDFFKITHTEILNLLVFLFSSAIFIGLSWNQHSFPL